MTLGKLIVVVVTTTLRLLEVVPPDPPPADLRRCEVRIERESRCPIEPPNLPHSGRVDVAVSAGPLN